jgi:hypothetical protein
MTNIQILEEMAKTARVEQADAIRWCLDLLASIQVEDASTNGDDDMPSLPVYGNVDLDTLVALGLWQTGKQIRFRKNAKVAW